MSRMRRLLLGIALALFGVACASESSAVRRVDELPEKYRTVWQAWLDADPEWPTLRSAVQEDPQLASFLVDNLVVAMVRAYDRADFTNLTGENLGQRGRFERARAELLLFKSVSAPVLAELLCVGDGVVAGLADGLLLEIGRDAIEPTRALLTRTDQRARQRAAGLLGRLPYALAGESELQSELAGLLESDSSYVVRAAAAETLGRRGYRGRSTDLARGALVRALGDEEQAVALTAVAGLRHLHDPKAIPALINYLERQAQAQNAKALKTTVAALGTLSGGQTLGIDGRAWRDWWRAERESRTTAPGAQK